MSEIVRSTIPSDLSESDYVDCECNEFKSVDDMLKFIRIMLPYRNVIDYNTYGKLICSSQTIHKQIRVQTNDINIPYNNGYGSSGSVNYKYNKIRYESQIPNPETVPELKHLNLKSNEDNCHVEHEIGFYNSSSNYGYFHYHVKTSASLVIVDTKNKCRRLKLPQHQFVDLIRLFKHYGDKDFKHSGLLDVNIGRYVYICDVLYNRSNNRIYYDSKEIDVPIDLKPFFSKTKPSSTIFPEYNQFDKTSYKYINDNLEMIKKDLQITNIDNYKPFDQKRYDSIQYIPVKDSENNEKLLAKRKQLIAKLKAIDNELDDDDRLDD